MKKYFFVISALLFLASSNVYADTFTWYGVYSNVAEYDQTDFPGKMGYSIITAQANVAENPPVDTVTLDSTPTGGVKSLTWNDDLKIFLRHWTNPPIGADWETTYTFQSGTSTGTLDLSGCTFRKLSIPQVTISNGGKTISWAPVAHATYYRLYWYNIDPSTGLPTGAKVADTGNLTDTSYTMQNPPPSGTTLAVRVMAREYCPSSSSGRLVNLSSLYKIDEITDTPIPTVSEWGIISFAVLLAFSAIFVVRKRQRA